MNFDDIFSQFQKGGFGGGGGFRHGGHHHQQEQREPEDTLFENSDVVKLDLSSVFQFYRRKEIWVILFYKHLNQESQDLKDEYITLAEKMFGILKVGAINCHTEEELCEEFSMFDTPSILIFTESGGDDGMKFTGKKQWKSISSAASAKM